MSSPPGGRLRSVLRIRELAERRAMGQVAESRRDVATARRRVAERVDAIRALAPPHRPLTPLELRALQLQGLAHHDLVVEASAEAELADGRHAELVRAWSYASQQRKSVERLADQRRVEAAVDARRAADRALDEAVLLRRRNAR